MCVLWKERRGGSRRWGRARSECICVFSAHWVRAASASEDWEEEGSEPSRHLGSVQAERTAGTKYGEEVPRYLRSSQEVGAYAGSKGHRTTAGGDGQQGKRNQSGGAWAIPIRLWVLLGVTTSWINFGEKGGMV